MKKNITEEKLTDSDYSLQLLENLNQHDYYNLEFDKIKQSIYKLYRIYIIIDFSQNPTKLVLDKETKEIETYWIKERKLKVTLFLWKNNCTFLSINNSQLSIVYDDLWFKDITIICEKITNQFEIFYKCKLYTFIEAVKSTRLSPSFMKGWRNRTLAYHELFNIPQKKIDDSK